MQCAQKVLDAVSVLQQKTVVPANPMGPVPLTHESNERCIPDALPINYTPQAADKDFTAAPFLESRTYSDQDAITAPTLSVGVKTRSVEAYSPFAEPYRVCLDYWEPSPTADLVLCSSAAELHYFGQILCCHLLICDPVDNPIRNVTVAKVRTSALYNALLRYLTMEYLNKTIMNGSARKVFDAARLDTMMNVEEVISRTTPTEQEGLLALIMFGLAASWDGSNNTGAYYYRHAVYIYLRTGVSMSQKDRSFYKEALAYWWSGLTFVVDTRAEALPEPPRMPVNSDAAISESLPIVPHPLAGVSPQTYELVGKVGRLVFNQRKLALQQAFFSFATIKAQEQMLEESQRLENELRSLRLPTTKEVIETYDTNTPAVDLCNTAEAFRLCGLLLLYRCFPDLLRSRFAQERAGEQTAMEKFMSSSALQALGALERNALMSRTKSVEQMLLVIIAGELRLPKQRCPRPFPLAFPDAYVLPTFSATMPMSMFEGTGSCVVRDSIAPVVFGVDSRRCATTVDDGVNVQTEVILSARAKVSARMGAVRTILPYRSVEQAEELIWNVWNKSDNGEDVFWVDEMIRSGARFVMV